MPACVTHCKAVLWHILHYVFICWLMHAWCRPIMMNPSRIPHESSQQASFGLTRSIIGAFTNRSTGAAAICWRVAPSRACLTMYSTWGCDSSSLFSSLTWVAVDMFDSVWIKVTCTIMTSRRLVLMESITFTDYRNGVVRHALSKFVRTWVWGFHKLLIPGAVTESDATMRPIMVMSPSSDKLIYPMHVLSLCVMTRGLAAPVKTHGHVAISIIPACYLAVFRYSAKTANRLRPI